MRTGDDLRALQSFYLADIGQCVKVELEDGDKFEGEVISKKWEGFVEGYLLEIKLKSESINIVFPFFEVIHLEKIPCKFDSGQLCLFEAQMFLVFLNPKDRVI